MAFFSGALNRVSFYSFLGSTYVTLSNFRHNMRVEDQGHEVTSAGHEGQQAFIASILRGEATASFHINDTAYPWTTLIAAQQAGIFKFEFGNRKPFIFPVYISVVEYMNETAAGSDWTVTVKLNKEIADMMGIQFQAPS